MKHGEFRVWLCLGLLALLMAASRLPVLNAPINRDVATYAIIGNGLLHGRQLYADLWDHKPPAIHVTYAAAIAALGERPAAIYALSLAAALVTLIGVAAATAALGPDRAGVLWACVAWAICSGKLSLEGDMPNTEVFVSAFLVFGFAGVVAALRRPPVHRLIAGTAACFLLATLYKHIAVIVPIGIIAVLMCNAKSAVRASVLKWGLAWLLAGVLGWSLVAEYFAAKGHYADFYKAVFSYNRYYAGSIGDNLLTGLTITHFFTPSVRFAAPWLAIFGIGSVVGKCWTRCEWWVLVGFIAAGATMVVLPGRAFPHYWLLVLPPICISFGVGVAWLEMATPGRTVLVRSVAACALLAAAIPDVVALSVTPKMRVAYRGHGDLERIRELGVTIGSTLPRNCGFFEIGSETQLYFYSGRQPQSGVFYFLPVASGPLAAELAARVVRTLRADPPCLLIVNSAVPMPDELRELVVHRYEPLGYSLNLPVRRERLEIMLRRDPPSQIVPELLVSRLKLVDRPK